MPTVPDQVSLSMLYATAEARTWRLWNTFALKENVTTTNFIAFVLASGLAICMYVFLSSTQGFVLGQILHVPVSKIGDISGNLTLFDELVSLGMVYLWGIYSDRVGRNKIYALGFVLIGLGLIAYPFARNYNLDLIAFRGVFALGAAGTSSMLTAVLADYAGDQDRGKISGLVGLMSGVGALFAVFVFLRLPARFHDPVEGLRIAYGIVGGVAIAFGVFLLWGLRPKIRQKTPLLLHDQDDVRFTRVPTIWTGYKAGLKAAKDGKVLLGYMGSFLARGDTIIITIFLPLWVYKYYKEHHLCDTAGSDIPEDCHKAYITASIVSGVVQTAALVSAPVFGCLGDCFYRPLVVLMSTVVGFVGYLWMFASTDPTSSIMYVVAIVVGIGEMGIVVSSLSLVTSKAIPCQVRGSVSGAYSFFGTIGILITSKLGGYLFDQWTSTAPFLVMAVGNAICALTAVVVILRDSRHAQTYFAHERMPLLSSLKYVQKVQDELKLAD